MLKRLSLLIAFLVIGALSQSSVRAQVGLPTTFALPVTSDTGGYRKFDSTAITGYFHTGDDYYNKDLKALAANCGVVVSRFVDGQGDHGFGNAIIIKHMLMGGPVYTLYAHLASFAPGTDVNAHVRRGQQIGVIGKTGKGSGGIVHLHFEIKKSPVLTNPSAFGSVAAGTQFGYALINAGTKRATSATDYGYFRPSSFYGGYVAFCY